MSAFSQASPLAARAMASPNFGERRGHHDVDMIVLHYTGCASAEAALLWMCSPDSQVSAHYLVDEDGEIVQLVDEAARAWHAGLAEWEGGRDVNSRSIGVEIQNTGHQAGALPEYPPAQIAAVIALCRDIMERHGIAPFRVVGHSDVAPQRKADPGEHFPWHVLGRAGVALEVEPAPLSLSEPVLAPGCEGEAVLRLQGGLLRAGYGLAQSGLYCGRTEAVVRAFQRRFRPQRVDGIADASTVETLRRVCARLDRIV